MTVRQYIPQGLLGLAGFALMLIAMCMTWSVAVRSISSSERVDTNRIAACAESDDVVGCLEATK